MPVMEDSGLGEPCTRCTEAAIAMCVECGDMVCRGHVDLSRRSGPWGFSSRLGSQLAICRPCNRKRFWRFSRGAGALLLFAGSFVAWMEELPTIALACVLALIAWWFLTSRFAAAAATALAKERGQ